ncbi:lactonase family protein [Paenibacillus oenotherae]|uniref:Lactonase family protein n=1 Tax=Paenibacillus oenotherae TaxID=1435645 RepID=A0ABS7DBS9_9BACL|nr:lactonase family protein [Paenibacillus oenotherae]MBW7477395.1 lactonase family protein [Paenibacillus oenotherae]
MKERLLYVGSYAAKDEEGITGYRFQYDEGKLEKRFGMAGIANPSFLTLNSDRTRLYAVSEASDGDGIVASFAIHESSGELILLNKRTTYGSAPCHVMLDGEEEFLVVTNYLGGNVVLYRVEKDGSIGPIADNVAHEGHGPRSDRQEKAHPHSSIMDPSNRYVIVADLGIDKLVHYRLDREAGKLILHRETVTASGAGPRHLAFHSGGRLLYVLNELDCTVAVYSFRAEDSELVRIQIISALPESFDGENTSADIHVTGCGRYLYASNRGHDSIVVYRIDDEGLLALVEHVPSGGRIPRNFALAPDDQFLLAANQDTHEVVVFRIDPETGRLLETSHIINGAAPVCIQFV